MRELFGNREVAIVGHYRSILEQAGIPCFVRNENAAALSELQGPAFYPVLCVDDDYYDEAMAVLLPYYQQQREEEQRAAAHQDWSCARCGEMVPAGFDFCWNCEQERPAKVDGLDCGIYA
jgi:hypothetical protein